MSEAPLLDEEHAQLVGGARRSKHGERIMFVSEPKAVDCIRRDDKRVGAQQLASLNGAAIGDGLAVQAAPVKRRKLTSQ